VGTGSACRCGCRLSQAGSRRWCSSRAARTRRTISPRCRRPALVARFFAVDCNGRPLGCRGFDEIVAVQAQGTAVARSSMQTCICGPERRLQPATGHLSALGRSSDGYYRSRAAMLNVAHRDGEENERSRVPDGFSGSSSQLQMIGKKKNGAFYTSSRVNYVTRTTTVRQKAEGLRLVRRPAARVSAHGREHARSELPRAAEKEGAQVDAVRGRSVCRRERPWAVEYSTTSRAKGEVETTYLFLCAGAVHSTRCSLAPSRSAHDAGRTSATFRMPTRWARSGAEKPEAPVVGPTTPDRTVHQRSAPTP